MFFLAFGYFLVRMLVKNLQQPSCSSLVYFALGIVVLSGFATHSLIKFRPYMSQPVLSYKATLSILGVALLIAYIAQNYWQRWRGTRKGIVVLAGLWLILATCSLTQASWQRKVMPRVGISSPPDPLARFK